MEAAMCEVAIIEDDPPTSDQLPLDIRTY